MPLPTVEIPDGYDVRDPEQTRLRSRYDVGDRSPEAKRAKSLYNAWQRRRRAEEAFAEETKPVPIPRPEPPVAARGASRRLQALAWCGYDLEQLEAQMAISRNHAIMLLGNPPAEIPASLHKAIAARYRQMIIVKPAATPAGERMRRVARAAGWAGPLAWDDIDQGQRAWVSHNAKDLAEPSAEEAAAEARLEAERLRDELASVIRQRTLAESELDDTRRKLTGTLADRDTTIARLEADLARIVADQRRADLEHTSTAAAVDEYAALKLKAEGDCADTRAALIEAGNEIDRLKTANAIYREQIVEGEDRATAANARALAAERDALQLRDDLANEQEAYRKLHASSRQLQQSFDELAAMKAVREDVAVRPAGQPTRVGELVVEQTPDGTRLVYTSRKPARITLGGVEVEIPA